MGQNKLVTSVKCFVPDVGEQKLNCLEYEGVLTANQNRGISLP